MDTRLKSWFVFGLFLTTAVYALAEDITLTTYYPSPRGVYQELRTAGDMVVGNIATAPGARLHVIQDDPASAVPVFRADDETSETSPFLIDATGNVGIGTTSPAEKLEVNGAVKLDGIAGAHPGPALYHSTTGGGIFGLTGAAHGFVFNNQADTANQVRIDESGNVVIGTSVPTNPAPNGQPGNLDANDVFVRSAGGGAGIWMSTVAIDFGGIYTFDSPGNCVHPNPYTGACSCPPGFTDYQFANGVAGIEQFFWFCGR